MSAQERSGWRDEALSKRHRGVFGYNSPMVDIDHFICAEYDKRKCVGLCDYKHYQAGNIDISEANYHALVDLAAHRPFWIARYFPQTWAYVIYPCNDAAKQWFNTEQRLRLTELVYIDFLYQLRGRDKDSDTRIRLDALNDIEPPSSQECASALVRPSDKQVAAYLSRARPVSRAG